MRHKIRGKVWRVEYPRKLPDNAKGLCDSPTTKNKRIAIKQSLRGLKKLEILLHEGVHAGLWDLDEEAVTELASDLAPYIWKEMGFNEQATLAQRTKPRSPRNEPGPNRVL